MPDSEDQPYVIESIYAFIATDPADGDEGIVSVQLGAVHMPMIAADAARLASLFPYADHLAATGVQVHLVEFTGRRPVDTLPSPAAKQQETASFVCPKCAAESWHPEDRRQGYCGRCHEFNWSRHQPRRCGDTGMSTAAVSVEEMNTRLGQWARGSLPAQAAVEFIVGTGTLYERHPMVGHNETTSWLDLDVDQETWANRTGGMSSGELATWRLARSIMVGELEDTFWRLDGRRKQLFLSALTWNAS